MARTERAKIAQETVAIVERGEYLLPGGNKVAIHEAVQRCLQSTAHFSPEQLADLQEQATSTVPRFEETQIIVENETTLAGARRLVSRCPRVTALNFASAKNPGGGFLGGSQAQEESLARSSALYHSLLKAPEYYDAHRQMRSALYSDRMILSPNCPVFRDDAGELLPEPYHVSFVTSAAPNAGAVAANHPADLRKLPETLRRRAEYVLALAHHHGAETLVLGAWGCGVFRNDPELVANVFAELLLPGRPWHGRFSTVLFAVLETTGDQAIYRAFAGRLKRCSNLRDWTRLTRREWLVASG